jgi:hypothetical protein
MEQQWGETVSVIKSRALPEKRILSNKRQERQYWKIWVPEFRLPDSYSITGRITG